MSQKNLKKKQLSLSSSRVIRFRKKGRGRMSYVKTSGSSKIRIDKKSGKVTLKKGLKKGKYKVTVKIKAAGGSNYKASSWKKATFRIIVK